jgi:pimeloyl-ACP methyl ester carboxylesterase
MPSPFIVLLHGVPTDHRIWDGVVAALGRDARCITPDLPGYGDEPTLPLEKLTIDGHLAWLERLRERHGLPAWPEVHLVGTDYGGLVAAAMAATSGAASLTLCSTALGVGWLPAKIMAAPLLHRWFYRRHGGRLWLTRSVGPAVRDRWMAMFEPGLADPILADHMRATARGISLNRLRQVVRELRTSGVPTACIWGADDRFYPGGRWLARRLGARFTAVPKARHGVPFEAPEAFARALRKSCGLLPV